ncbi:Hpt domain-containing protein, partial [Pantoea sp. SIMBA_133]
MATTRRTDDDAVTAQDIPEVEDTVADSGEEEQETPQSIVEEATVEAVSDESADDDDLIDDEILEIFVEEAGEVLDTIREYLPMLLRQHDDRSALSEVRRAFHTLKGSGRMVGALVV